MKNEISVSKRGPTVLAVNRRPLRLESEFNSLLYLALLKGQRTFADKRTIGENNRYTKYTGSINKLSKMNAPVIDVN